MTRKSGIEHIGIDYIQQKEQEIIDEYKDVRIDRFQRLNFVQRQYIKDLIGFYKPEIKTKQIFSDIDPFGEEKWEQ